MPSDSERRKWVRHPVGPQILCELVVAAVVKVVPRAVHNVSAGGCRLSLDLDVSVGAEGVARFTDRAERFYCQRAFRVVYCHEAPSRDFVTGLAFQRNLAPDELARLKRLAPP
jgi:hypothetical protein